MQANFANRPPERKTGAALTAAIHVALLAALLSFRPDVAEPVEPERPLAVDLLPAPLPEAPVVEPVPVEEAPSVESRQRLAAPAAGAPAPEKLRREIDRTGPVTPAPSFPAGPEPWPELGSAGEIGTGLAGGGTGSGAGIGGSGTGSGTGAGAPFVAPHWIAKPTFRQMALHNPWRAAREQVSGTALLACRIDSRQRARSCRILRESPGGYGFGTAAVAAVRLGRISPAMRGGLPDYKAWVGIPVTFRNCGDRRPDCVSSVE